MKKIHFHYHIEYSGIIMRGFDFVKSKSRIVRSHQVRKIEDTLIFMCLSEFGTFERKKLKIIEVSIL